MTVLTKCRNSKISLSDITTPRYLGKSGMELGDDKGCERVLPRLNKRIQVVKQAPGSTK